MILQKTATLFVGDLALVSGLFLIQAHASPFVEVPRVCSWTLRTLDTLATDPGEVELLEMTDDVPVAPSAIELISELGKLPWVNVFAGIMGELSWELGSHPMPHVVRRWPASWKLRIPRSVPVGPIQLIEYQLHLLNSLYVMSALSLERSHRRGIMGARVLQPDRAVSSASLWPGAVGSSHLFVAQQRTLFHYWERHLEELRSRLRAQSEDLNISFPPSRLLWWRVLVSLIGGRLTHPRQLQARLEAGPVSWQRSTKVHFGVRGMGWHVEWHRRYVLNTVSAALILALLSGALSPWPESSPPQPETIYVRDHYSNPSRFGASSVFHEIGFVFLEELK